MKDPIINYIDDNREAFDGDLPDAKTWEGVHKELHPEDKKRTWLWYKIAAVFVVVLGFGYLLTNGKFEETEEVAEVSNENVDSTRAVIRGGSWKDISYYLSSGNRSYEYQDNAESYVGYRSVMTYLGRGDSYSFGHDLDPNYGYYGFAGVDQELQKLEAESEFYFNKIDPNFNAGSVAPGTYSVTVTDANGCESVDNVNSAYTYMWSFGDSEQTIEATEKPTNGEFITYNDFGYVEMEGEFKNGGLHNGSHHVYDANGNLMKTELYKNGVFDGYSYLSPYENPGYYYEQYDQFEENAFVTPMDEPLSTFGIDVDAAGYSNMRRYINDGYLPPKDAIKLEEMVNYFEYDLPEPNGDHPFSITTEVGHCPWNKRNKLVQICIKGKTIPMEELPPSNLVFLLDVSGSMEDANKLPLLKQGFEMLVKELRPEDRVSIVTYAGAAGVVLEPTSGKEKEKILMALNNLSAGGSTAGGEGILMAYKLAEENLMKDGNSRIILATDGDFNVGVSDDQALVELIEEKRKSGVFLSVLGFGEGNLQSSKMEKLADNGNGNYSYIDNILEAKKVLVSEFGGTLYTIAKDVKLQLEFNPQEVGSYRLLGYENRLLAPEDFEDDTKDAGDLGSGHTIVAFYEITPKGKASDKMSDLKYQEIIFTGDHRTEDELMTINFRYKEPTGKKSKLITKVVGGDIAKKPSENFQFASAVAEFGLLIRESDFKGAADFEDLITRAKYNKGHDFNGYRSEFVKLAEMGQLLWQEYDEFQDELSKLK